jgi:hypothetical protein
MYVYQQKTGQWLKDGELIGVGGAGNGPGFNNPLMQSVHDVGPLPRGLYTIQPAEDDAKLGPVAMELIPDPENQMFGRSGFYIHGWSATLGILHSSKGCPMAPCVTRDGIALGVPEGDNRLQVV